MKAFTLSTPNLLIRGSTVEDCRFFYEYELDPEISEHFSINDNRTMEDMTAEFKALQNGAEGPVLLLTVVKKDGDIPIGRFIIPFDERRNHAHIDWFYLCGKNRNSGFGSESLDAVLRHFFKVLDLERVGIDYFSTNQRVESLYRRKGFQREGILRHYTRKNGQYLDLVYMSILKDEYLSLAGDAG